MAFSHRRKGKGCPLQALCPRRRLLPSLKLGPRTRKFGLPPPCRKSVEETQYITNNNINEAEMCAALAGIFYHLPYSSFIRLIGDNLAVLFVLQKGSCRNSSGNYFLQNLAKLYIKSQVLFLSVTRANFSWFYHILRADVYLVSNWSCPTTLGRCGRKIAQLSLI